MKGASRWLAPKLGPLLTRAAASMAKADAIWVFLMGVSVEVGAREAPIRYAPHGGPDAGRRGSRLPRWAMHPPSGPARPPRTIHHPRGAPMPTRLVPPLALAALLGACAPSPREMGARPNLPMTFD